VDASGNLYVTDSTNGTVSIYPSGGGTGSTVISGLNSPAGLAVDSYDNLFESSWNGNTVTEYAAALGYFLPIPIGSGYQNPGGLAVDAAGDVYVADYGNGKVEEILNTVGYGNVVELPANLRRRVYRPQGWISPVLLVNGLMQGVFDTVNRHIIHSEIEGGVFLAKPSSGYCAGDSDAAPRLQGCNPVRELGADFRATELLFHGGEDEVRCRRTSRCSRNRKRRVSCPKALSAAAQPMSPYWWPETSN
jgi:hypothetical protein